MSACLRRLSLLIIPLLAASCMAVGPSGGPTSSPQPSIPTTGQSATPTGNPGLYLRLSQSQALAPQYTFGDGPLTVIADGRFYDGLIAIPTIYPGPIYIGRSDRTISVAAQAAVIDTARADGLLSGTTTFGTSLPGGLVCQVSLRAGGTDYALRGTCPDGTNIPAIPTPGTEAAYWSFWAYAVSLGTTASADLGQSVPYTPDRLAVLASPPTAVTGGPITPTIVAWPLATPFARFGIAYGSTDIRCATVSGSDLAALLPAVEAANVLTRFTDSVGVAKTLAARPMLPGEPDVC